jgi:hypothetical protein
MFCCPFSRCVDFYDLQLRKEAKDSAGEVSSTRFRLLLPRVLKIFGENDKSKARLRASAGCAKFRRLLCEKCGFFSEGKKGGLHSNRTDFTGSKSDRRRKQRYIALDFGQALVLAKHDLSFFIIFC